MVRNIEEIIEAQYTDPELKKERFIRRYKDLQNDIKIAIQNRDEKRVSWVSSVKNGKKFEGMSNPEFYQKSIEELFTELERIAKELEKLGIKLPTLEELENNEKSNTKS